MGNLQLNPMKKDLLGTRSDPVWPPHIVGQKTSLASGSIWSTWELTVRQEVQVTNGSGTIYELAPARNGFIDTTMSRVPPRTLQRPPAISIRRPPDVFDDSWELLGATSTSKQNPIPPGNEHVSRFLEYVRQLDQSGKARPAVRAVFRAVLALIECDAINVVDAVLRSVTPSELSVEVGLAFLAITVSKEPLPSRKGLYERMKSHLEDIGRSEADIVALLAGLEPPRD